ncbi:hypothetical protein ACFL3J_02825 [Candidatus Omnitrophota bacterium]
MLLNVINTVLCVMIVFLGIIGYKKNKEKLPLFIGIAFVLFGISHVVTIVGLNLSWLNFLITIRLIAYLIVAFALYQIAVKK